MYGQFNLQSLLSGWVSRKPPNASLSYSTRFILGEADSYEDFRYSRFLQYPGAPNQRGLHWRIVDPFLQLYEVLSDLEEIGLSFCVFKSFCQVHLFLTLLCLLKSTQRAQKFGFSKNAFQTFDHRYIINGPGCAFTRRSTRTSGKGD